MGLPAYYQDAGLYWLRGVAFPPPPAELWLAVHRAVPASEGNQAGDRVAVPIGSLGTPRNGSRDALPQDPWVPGNGELREITNIAPIRSGLLSQAERLVAFSLWDAASSGVLVLRGRLQQEVDVAAGEVFSLDPGNLLIRFTSP